MSLLLTFIALFSGVGLLEQLRRAAVWPLRFGLALGALLPGPGMFLAAQGDLREQKIVSYLIMPTGLIWLAGIAVLFALLLRRKWRGAAVTAMFVLAYSVAGNGLVAWHLAAELDSAYPPVDIAKLEKLDAVFVLGGGTKQGPVMAELNSHGDRVMLAARIYHAGKTRWLVASGHGIPGLSDEDLALQTIEIWTSLGIPAETILRLSDPRNTSEEVRAFGELSALRGFQRVGVVSSSWHLPRVMAKAQKLGLTFIPLPADHSYRRPEFSALWLIPSGPGFQGVYQATWERVGRAVGR